MIIVESDSSTPLVRFKIHTPMGAVYDPQGFEGLTHLSLALARSGTQDKGREELDMAIDVLGASLDFRCGYHSASLEGSVLSEHLGDLLTLAVDILSNAKFSNEDFDRLVRESQTALLEVQDDPESLLSINYRNSADVYAPYHRPIIGTSSSLQHITRNKAKDWFQSLFQPKEMIVGISGDITSEGANDFAKRIKACLPNPKASFRAPLFKDTIEADKTFYYYNKPSNDQCNIELAIDAPRCQDDLYPALLVANSVLGELESSRLNQNIRAKEGWVYSVYSSIERHPDKNILSITCNPALEFSKATIETILQTCATLSTEGITKDEFELAQANIIGSLDFVSETCHRRMALRIRNSFFELPTSYYEDLKSKLKKTSREDVNAFLKTCFEHTTIGLVGPWEELTELKEALSFTFKEMKFGDANDSR